MTQTIVFDNENILNVKELKMSIRQSLKNIIEKEGFKSYKVSLNDMSTKGGNYFGILQNVTVKGKSENGDKELYLFLKNIVPINDTNFIIDVSEMHKREGFFYKELVNLYEELQDKYKIPQEERFYAVKVYDVTDCGLLVMEDISKAGYTTFDRLEAVSLKLAELSIEQLAKFHALSFVLKKEYPKFFAEKIESLRIVQRLNDNYETHLRRIINIAMETLDDDARKRLENYVSKMMDRYSTCLDIPTDEAVCIGHGDYRSNNILMTDTNGEPCKVIPVDYQFLNFSSPVIDFIYFVFTGTDQKFRKNHLDNLKDFYYSNFENFLSKFDIDAEEVYSKKQFEEEYRAKLDYGLLSFITLMPFIFAKADDLPELEKGIKEVKFHMEDCYKDRLHGVVDDYIQWGYL